MVKTALSHLAPVLANPGLPNPFKIRPASSGIVFMYLFCMIFLWSDDSGSGLTHSCDFIDSVFQLEFIV